jgi:hypothetical protein
MLETNNKPYETLITAPLPFKPTQHSGGKYATHRISHIASIDSLASCRYFSNMIGVSRARGVSAAGVLVFLSRITSMKRSKSRLQPAMISLTEALSAHSDQRHRGAHLRS